MGGQGVNFRDLCDRFGDHWLVWGSTLLTFVIDFVTSWGSGGSTLVTFVIDFVTSWGSWGSTLVTFVIDFMTFGVRDANFGDLCD